MPRHATPYGALRWESVVVLHRLLVGLGRPPRWPTGRYTANASLRFLALLSASTGRPGDPRG
eukprot:4179767-Lingulodinium_polyedra.AAC.1